MGERANISAFKRNLLKRFDRNNMNLAKEINRKHFLLRCRSLQLIPKFVYIKNKNFNFYRRESDSKYASVLNVFYFQIINICIGDCFAKLKFLRNEIDRTKIELLKAYLAVRIGARFH